MDLKQLARGLRRAALAAALPLAALTLAACAGPGGAGPGAVGSGAAAVPAPDRAEPGWKFVCSCSPGCPCGTTADRPGNCVCGRPLAYKKVLREDANNWFVCPCPDCSCTAVDPANPRACACGKLLRPFPKKGAYGCACGDCDCGTRADQAGPCVCGAPMRRQ